MADNLVAHQALTDLTWESCVLRFGGWCLDEEGVPKELSASRLRDAVCVL